MYLCIEVISFSILIIKITLYSSENCIISEKYYNNMHLVKITSLHDYLFLFGMSYIKRIKQFCQIPIFCTFACSLFLVSFSQLI